MTNETNRKTVEAIYAAFTQGDIDTVLEHFADEGVWIYTMPDGSVPFAGTFEGKSRIAEWFHLFGSSVQTTSFQTNRLLVDGDDVVVALATRTAGLLKAGRLTARTGSMFSI